MGDGRVTDIRPKTLKRIYFYEKPQVDQLDKNEAYEKNIKLLGYQKNQLDDDKIEYSLKIENNIQYDSKNYGKDWDEMQNDDKGSVKEFEEFNISSNNINNSGIYFTKNGKKELIPHKDGMLIDNKTGELLYFVVKEDVVGKGMLEKIEEGSKVEFTNKKRGVCEIILHKRDANNNIIGDIDLTKRGPAVVEFVEVLSVDEFPEILPQYEPQKLS